MSVNDVQIALGLLQLVALTLPVFALLTQVFFSIDGNQSRISIGLLLLAGGGALVAGAIFSAQSLYSNTNSAVLELSILAVTFGVFPITLLLYNIYKSMKRNVLQESRSTLDELDKIIQVMDEHDFETVEEFRDSDIELEDANEKDDDVETTIGDLKEQRKKFEEATSYFEQSIFSSYSRKQYLIGGILILIVSITVTVSPFLSSNPLMIVAGFIIGMLLFEIKQG
ncbi:hypothetical protein EXE43_08895 [Halorubrum sp. SS5]|nr:hypothetical protein EXE43_08895 [Halorubrum sp. SS5]